MSSTTERKLAAIMFTDIAGYTAQMSKDEAKAIELLKQKESILKPLLKEYKGTFVKSIGDGTLSYFESAINAASCAVRLQEIIYDQEDLNIRGSGDLFGLKQSGGEVVGVDLYSKILKDLVATYHKKDVAPLPFVSCESSAFIPSSFLPSGKMRVWFYKELSQTSLESFEGFLKKTRNLFGRFRLELKNLVGLRRVFLLSQVLFFSKVALKDNYIVVFPVVSFWEKKSSVLINSLSDLGFVFIEGGEGFKVPCLDNNFFIIFDKIYNRLHHAL